MKVTQRSGDDRPGQAPMVNPSTSNRRRLIGEGAARVAGLGTVLLASGVTAGRAQAQDGPELGGTWLAQLQRENPPPGFGPTRFLFTFTNSGDVIAAGPPVLVENGVRAFLTSQLGQWRAIAPYTFSFSFNTASYGDDGSFNYSINSTMEMTLASDLRSWSGTYTRNDVGADGATIRTVRGTASAQQI